MDKKLAHIESIRKKLRNLVILDLDNTCICAVELKDVNNLVNEIRGISVEILTINKEYTKFLLALKYTFMIFSFITCVIYWHRLKKLQSQHWIIE